MSALSACLLGLHLATAHVSQGLGSPDYNSRTAGAYVSCPSGLTVGALRNSYGRPSLYVARTWQAGVLSLTAGGITGYEAAPVLPLLSAGLSVPLSSAASARLSILPKAPKVGHSAAVHLSIEFKLKELLQ